MLERNPDFLKNWPALDQFEFPDATKKKRKKEKETIDILKELQRRQAQTPDFKDIRLKEKVLLFIYDDMKKGGLNNYFLTESDYLGVARTASNFYKMRTGIFPIVFDEEDKNTVVRGFIQGEIFAVSPETILAMDRLKCNGEMFSRKKRNFFLEEQHRTTKDGKKQAITVTAYIYIGVNEFWKHESLNPMTIYKPYGERSKAYFMYNAPYRHPPMTPGRNYPVIQRFHH
mgnify:CR=1 FL=1